MPRRRCIKGILCGFLGHFASRYSDYEGYWLFGLLITDHAETTIDLLGSTAASAGAGPLAAASRLAKVAFREQVAELGLEISRVREAHVGLVRSSTTARGHVNGRMTDGYDLTLIATAVSDLGTAYQSTTSIFVAPHNPEVEQRSARAGR